MSELELTPAGDGAPTRGQWLLTGVDALARPPAEEGRTTAWRGVLAERGQVGGMANRHTVHMGDSTIENVNSPAPRLSPIFRSDTQAEILARLLLNPDRSYTIAQIARLVGVSYASAHREVTRMVDMGLLSDDRVGQAIRVFANQSDPAYGPVAELLRMSYGPVAVLPRLFAGIAGIKEAYIYGSWAARRAGEKGDAPGDIDVLVVGNPARGAIHEAAQDAERILGREVNVRTISAEAWSAGADLFIRTVRERPRVQLHLEDETW